ncbi:telomerase RNA component interacting RNase [Scyliorhinus canicula]|uniref:telomerase RNA component interacting RNase n=1 Tax=Scyliorhinus canicula TaxID=7830 RepID=UPI0018F756CD|nr:telomerase RNA component interacting RNase [Scyliorhinus canicula]
MADRRRSREVSGSSETDGGGGGPESKGVNAFANDGSFMALFKKKMEEEEKRLRGDGAAAPSGGDVDNGGKRSVAAGQEQNAETQSDRKKSVMNIVGKRRGGAKLALKTGMVAKKHKAEEEAEARGGDAWAKYMAEVKKYKAHQCSDDDKTRPLVK